VLLAGNLSTKTIFSSTPTATYTDPQSPSQYTLGFMEREIESGPNRKGKRTANQQFRSRPGITNQKYTQLPSHPKVDKQRFPRSFKTTFPPQRNSCVNGIR